MTKENSQLVKPPKLIKKINFKYMLDIVALRRDSADYTKK